MGNLLRVLNDRGPFLRSTSLSTLKVNAQQVMQSSSHTPHLTLISLPPSLTLAAQPTPGETMVHGRLPPCSPGLQKYLLTSVTTRELVNIASHNVHPTKNVHDM